MNKYITNRVYFPEVIVEFVGNTAALCRQPYLDHPRGCPNFGKRSDCPPATTLYLPGQIVSVAAVQFHLEAWAEELKRRDPKRTERQCRCVLYWQGQARKALRLWIEECAPMRPVDMTPEGRGANVFAMMEVFGHPLDRSATEYVWKVAFIGGEEEA